MDESTEPKSDASLTPEDLVRMRTLAEEGRDAPLLGGVYYLVWGVLMGAASIVSYAHMAGLLSLGAFGPLTTWLIFGAAGWIATFLFSRRNSAKAGVHTIGNRTGRAVWIGVGVFMVVILFSIIAAQSAAPVEGVSKGFLFGFMFPSAFGAYGIAFFATAAASRISWLKYFAVLSWVFCALTIFFFASATQFLIGGLGCLACAALPGLILLRREPKDF